MSTVSIDSAEEFIKTATKAKLKYLGPKEVLKITGSEEPVKYSEKYLQK